MIDLLELKQTSQFKKDLKRVIKRGLPMHLMGTVILYCFSIEFRTKFLARLR